MKAKIAYLTSPAPNRFILNFQPEGEQSMVQFEITKGHLVNILIDGASYAFREQYPHRVPVSSQTESVDHHERADIGT